MAAVLTAKAIAVEPLRKAHAHNDYEHERPLLDALSHGFCSVEADVFAIDGQLLVAHNRIDVREDRTLRSLYLEPLRERIRKGNGYVYDANSQVTLLIDFKSDGRETYRLLRKELEEYKELFVAPKQDAIAPVQVVISGNRPFQDIQTDEGRLCGLDGRLSDLDSELSAEIMPLISDNWRSHFQYRGEGPMPDSERKRLQEIVSKAHESGRRVRFWATPESESLWVELLQAKVDHINTDRLADLKRFLLQQSAKPSPPSSDQ